MGIAATDPNALPQSIYQILAQAGLTSFGTGADPSLVFAPPVPQPPTGLPPVARRNLTPAPPSRIIPTPGGFSLSGDLPVRSISDVVGGYSEMAKNAYDQFMQGGRNLMGQWGPQPAGSTGPMPRVPPGMPTGPGPGAPPAAAAGAPPVVAPPIAASHTPTGPTTTPAQIFNAAAQQGPGAGSMWDDPGFEFGLRLMEASQPQQGSHRGPGIFAALAGAGLGQMQTHRAQAAAKMQYELEQSKVKAQNEANILTAQSNAQFKELQAKIQAGQLDISKGQLRAEVEKNRDAEKSKNPYRIPGAGAIDDKAAAEFDADVDKRYDGQLRDMGVNSGKDTDPVGAAGGSAKGSPVATRVVNGKTYVQYSDGSVYLQQ